MALCHITGTLFIPDGSEAANRRIQFQKLATDVVTDDYAGAVVPEVIPTKTDANGDVDVYLITGYYVGTVLDRRGNRSYTFKATVPDQATANIADLISASDPVEPLPAWLQEALAARDASEAAEAGAIAAADDAQDSADAAANSASSLLGLPLVRYDAQTLTGPQQQQSRQNIGLTLGATAATNLGITSVGSNAGGSYIDIQAGAERWRFLYGSVAKTPDAYGEFEVTYGFSFLTTPYTVVSNGDAAAASGNIILSSQYQEVGGFWVAARNLSGGAHLGAFRVNFSVFGRIA